MVMDYHDPGGRFIVCENQTVDKESCRERVANERENDLSIFGSHSAVVAEVALDGV